MAALGGTAPNEGAVPPSQTNFVSHFNMGAAIDGGSHNIIHSQPVSVQAGANSVIHIHRGAEETKPHPLAAAVGHIAHFFGAADSEAGVRALAASTNPALTPSPANPYGTNILSSK